MNQRAYSVLTIKAVDREKRVIEGIASTPTPDRVGDIVEPKGADYTLPIPFLWQHQADSPIGHVTSVKIKPEGIEIRAQLQKTDEPGELKNLLDRAWQSIDLGLVRGLSIGFVPKEYTFVEETGGMRFVEWEWLELSAVTIPANVEATITTVKSHDMARPAASGNRQEANATTKKPGVSGPVAAITKKTGARTMTIKEQIAQFENTRAAKDARRTELMSAAANAGVTLDAQQEEEYDTLTSEIEAVDKHLVRLRAQEKANAALAVTVDGKNTDTASKSREPVPVVTVKPTVDKGIGFARYAIALAYAKGNRFEAVEVAKARWPDQPEVQALIKAAVAAGTTTDASWAGPLAVTQPLANEFLELLRPSTLIGKLDGRMRRVPFNISLPRVTSGGSVAWVGQGSAKPLTALAFDTVTLDFAKAAGIVVLTEELVRLSTPSAEQTVRDTMVDTMRVFLDTQFIDSTVAAVANVNPASITNGVTGTAASGTTEAAARADLRALLALYATNNLPLDGVVLIMSESTAFTLGTMVNAVGQPAFPGINVQGGNILGIPVITSNVVGNQIVAAHAPSILYADEGQTEIDVSREASVQMDSAPDNPTTSATVMVSLWQRNMVGLRFERFINWKKARTNVVQRITSVAYA